MLAKLRGSILLRDATGVFGLLTVGILLLLWSEDDGVKERLEGGALLLLVFLSLVLKSDRWLRGGLLLVLIEFLDNGVDDLLGVGGEDVLLVDEVFDLEEEDIA